MLSFKNGVRLIGINPELIIGIMVVQSAFEELGPECVITSITDGKHSRGSLHYAGCACDFRTRHLSDEIKNNLFALIKNSLGPDFDFITEATHYHLEFQPKEPY